MKRNVMIFSGGSYPGIEVYYALKDSVVFNPIMASSYSDHSRFVSSNYISDMPFTYEDDFVIKLNEQIQKHNVEFIIPTHDTIAKVLMDNELEIDATIVCSPKTTTDLCRSKRKTYEALSGKSYVTKMYHLTTDHIEFPAFAKPDDGQGAQGTIKVENFEDLSRIADDANMVICEYLPGKEYTVDCFTNNQRELVFINPRTRSRIQYGISARAESVEDKERFVSIVEDINKSIKFRGYWFVQFKEDINGNLKVLELCTRFAGSFNHSQGLGVNLPLMAVSDFAGMKVSTSVNNYSVVTDKTFIDRYELNYIYKRVYIDYDDTITSDGGKKVNWLVMGFLYQCRNKNVEIVLITRHSDSKQNSIGEDLEIMSIPHSLFNRIIELKWEDKKEDVINSDVQSIFVDNSFAERLAVSKKHGIPVFDVNHILCLYDWRL